jgi:histidine triad (HIT) family protein
MNDCLFCKIIAKQVPANIVYEDEQTIAFLDIFPVSKGHMLIVPKEHAVTLHLNSRNSTLAIMETAHKLARPAMEALDASGYNLGMNCGIDAGQEIMHTHLHFMPRYSGQSRSFTKTKTSREELAEVAALIIKKL